MIIDCLVFKMSATDKNFLYQSVILYMKNNKYMWTSGNEFLPIHEQSLAHQS